MSDSNAVTRIGFITGIQKEAAILKNTVGIEISDIKCSGANSDRAYELACKLAKDGSKILLSFGIAGALDQTLNPGDLIIPDLVLHSNDGSFETSADQLKIRLDNRIEFKSGSLLGSNKLIASASKKLSLFKSTGAIAVDMESMAVAKAARDYNLPFLVVRAISDTAGQNLPSAILSTIDDQGKTRIGTMLWELTKRPYELPGLIKLAINSNKAFATLRRVATLIVND